MLTALIGFPDETMSDATSIGLRIVAAHANHGGAPLLRFYEMVTSVGVAAELYSLKHVCRGKYAVNWQIEIPVRAIAHGHFAACAPHIELAQRARSPTRHCHQSLRLPADRHGWRGERPRAQSGRLIDDVLQKTTSS